ncbi:MAG: hypothetical protein AAFQ99_09485, partial [Pseudomonadota bacterium]
MQLCLVVGVSQALVLRSVFAIAVVLGIGTATSVMPNSAMAQANDASQASCARCESIEAVVGRVSTLLQARQRALSQAYARVRRIDDEVARLNTSKERNQRAVSNALRERRGTTDAARLATIEARLRDLSEQTADLDARV